MRTASTSCTFAMFGSFDKFFTGCCLFHFIEDAFISSNDKLGDTVTMIGDVNGDGIDDFAVGATDGDPNREQNAGEAYIIFGNTSGFGVTFDPATLNGTNGFVINGEDNGDGLGYSISGAGDESNRGQPKESTFSVQGRQTTDQNGHLAGFFMHSSSATYNKKTTTLITELSTFTPFY